MFKLMLWFVLLLGFLPVGFGNGEPCHNVHDCHATKCRDYHHEHWTVTCENRECKCIELRPCDTNPCQYNGTCIGVDGSGQHHCRCQRGFDGVTCHENRMCRHHGPCQNHGHCQQHRSHPYYSCDCENGFTGFNCQIPPPTPRPACHPDTCHNHGDCKEDGSKHGYTCHCQPGFTGVHCVDNTHCSSNPCLNNGTCTPSPKSPYFRCDCQRPFYGETCRYTDTCLRNPCPDGNDCNRVRSSHTCTCPIGQDCNSHHAVGHCASQPCLHQGVCSNISHPPFFKCNCKHGFGGDTCEENHLCARQPCLNGGTCFNNTVPPFYSCTCALGYHGHHCKTESCPQGKCHHGGTCQPIDHEPFYQCHCASGYEGNTCSKIATPSPNHVTQVSPVTSIPVALTSSTPNIHSSYGGSPCLSCTDVVSPNTCEYIAYCGSHEDCYTDSYINSIGSVRYDLGCRDKRLCTGSLTKRGTHNTTRNKGEDPFNALICTECCSGELCNSGGCGTTGFPTASSGQRGPICLHCDQQNDHGDCNKIQVCGRDETCILETTSVGTSKQMLYRTGCELTQNCKDSGSHMDQGTLVCDKRCCSGDLCNNHC